MASEGQENNLFAGHDVEPPLRHLFVQEKIALICELSAVFVTM